MQCGDGSSILPGSTKYFMFLPTHLAAGLIIGKLSGDYQASLIGSVVMDLDHFIACFRAGILFKSEKLWNVLTGKANISLPQRNYFHNIFFSFLAAAAALLINFPAGLVFGLAYAIHLILDSLDNSNYYPFYPNLKINFHGPIKYFSRQEFIITLILLVVYFII